MTKDGKDCNSIESNEMDPFARLHVEFWGKMGTPIRPSEAECRIYEEGVRKAAQDKNLKILILGSTPEIRDIVHRYNLEPVCCDIDKRIWGAMTLMRKEPGEEGYIQSDWLEMPEDVQYDVVLGDCSLNMLQSESVEPFIKKTAGLTKKGGFNIQRIGTSDKKLTVAEFAKAMEDYRKNGFSMSVWLYTAMLFCSIGSYYFPQYTTRGIFQNELFKYLTEAEIAEINPFLHDKIIFFPRREELAKTLARYFEIDRIEESKGTGYWGAIHTYVMRRK